MAYKELVIEAHPNNPDLTALLVAVAGDSHVHFYSRREVDREPVHIPVVPRVVSETRESLIPRFFHRKKTVVVLIEDKYRNYLLTYDPVSKTGYGRYET